MTVHSLYKKMLKAQNKFLNRKNKIDRRYYDGVVDRYCNPVLSAESVPLSWRYDLDEKSNPFFIERLGINAVFNSGALYYQGKYWLMARVEGKDRKSFFALAVSENPVSGFHFVNGPVVYEDKDPAETNVYDIRMTLHEDGYIYGIYCSESKDPNSPENDTSSAFAKAAVLRTRDLLTFERLKDIVTPSSQQRNVALHPEFVNGKYLIYTRPQDGFIDTGSGSGIACGFIDSFNNPVIEKEFLIDAKKYHTVYEVKNGVGPSPIKTEKGWIHIAHGVRNTAAGLRYVLYAFATDLKDPTKVIAKPSGYFLAPFEGERVGDVSNVVFCNGAVINEKEEIYIYYASSDTRLHVAKTTKERLLDYVFKNPSEMFRSLDSAKQRLELIKKNLERKD